MPPSPITARATQQATLPPALRFWLAFGPQGGTVGGQPCWRLRDDLRELRLTHSASGLSLSQRWNSGTIFPSTPVHTAAALYAALTPPPALNVGRQRRGELITPVGRLHFYTRLKVDRFNVRRFTLTLMTAPGHRPVRCAGSPDWLHYTVCDIPPSHAPPPLTATRTGRGHTEPASGLRNRMNALSDAFWTALVTPDLRRDLLLEHLYQDLTQAQTCEQAALADLNYWQQACG